MNNDFARSSNYINSTNDQTHSLLEGIEGSSSSLTLHDQFTKAKGDIDLIYEDVQVEDVQQQIPMGQNQIVRTAGEEQEATPAAGGDNFHILFNDFALFDSSSIGVYEFSREFLAIARRHRFQPKAKAILLDLLQRIMPEDNRCPKTFAEMRKLVACNEHAYSNLVSRENFGCFAPPRTVSVDTIQPQLHYLLPQLLSTSNRNKPSKNKIHHFSDSSSYHGQIRNEFLERAHPMDKDYVEELTETAGPSKIYHSNEHPTNDVNCLLPHILQTIDRLSQEVVHLRKMLTHQSPPVRKINHRAVFSSDERSSGIHVYNVKDNVVLLNSLTRQQLQQTIDASRYDRNRLIYDHNDITEIVLEKIELAPYLHNPSLCGRLVADALFSPEYLSNKHIQAEGQFSSRARLELLPPEMTHLFYESLRKLGVSRIVEEDREHWLYLARDGVNQRARDLKANRKRKFYTDEYYPIFTAEERNE